MQNDASEPQATPTPITVVGSASLESWVNELMDAAPQWRFQFEHAQAEPSLESQQEDQANREKLLEKVQKELAKINDGHQKQTGPLQVFLLDGKGLGGGDLSSQATLRAMMKAALTDSSNIVAALLPQDPDSEDAHAQTDKLPVAIQGVVRNYLADAKLPVVTSQEQLIEFIQSR